MEHLTGWLTDLARQLGDRGGTLARASVILALTLATAWALSRAAGAFIQRHVDAPRAVLARRVIFYGVVALGLASTLRELGFDLSILLGAAGVLSVAIGFASQTTAANFVSGLFLLVERPFKAGDTVRIGDTTGEVLSVDLLSTKLRTFDNLFVRVPNETFFKSQVTNLTRFAIRRLDVPIGVAYGEDLARVRRILADESRRHAVVLEEPAPEVLAIALGDSAVQLELRVWVLVDAYLEARTTLIEAVRRRLDAERVVIPFPHRTLHGAPEPLAVRLVGPSEPPGG